MGLENDQSHEKRRAAFVAAGEKAKRESSRAYRRSKLHLDR